MLECQIHVETLEVTTPQSYLYKATTLNMSEFGDTQAEAIGSLIQQLSSLGEEPFIVKGITYE